MVMGHFGAGITRGCEKLPLQVWLILKPAPIWIADSEVSLEIGTFNLWCKNIAEIQDQDE